MCVAQSVKNLPAMQETQVWSLGWQDALEKGMETHSSTRAWRIPWTEEPGGATVHGVAKSRKWLSDFTFTFILVCVRDKSKFLHILTYLLTILKMRKTWLRKRKWLLKVTQGQNQNPGCLTLEQVLLTSALHSISSCSYRITDPPMHSKI